VLAGHFASVRAGVPDAADMPQQQSHQRYEYADNRQDCRSATEK
jgi:hypothetical protein